MERWYGEVASGGGMGRWYGEVVSAMKHEGSNKIMWRWVHG